jgi:hypothetical protein
VDDGLQQGWLKRFRRVPGKTGTEALYLFEVQSPGADEAGRQTQASEATLLGATSASADTTSLPDTQGARRQKFQNRSTEFEGHLQKSRIGSMPETREPMFDAIESIFETGSDGQNSGVLLPQLFSEVTSRARTEGDKRGYSAEKNWPVASKCVQRLMLWAGVLLSEKGEAIADKIGCNSTCVHSLLPDFRLVCEGFLATHIMRQMGGISYDDDPYYLGLTLYRRGVEKAVSAEELKTKADQILTYLDQQGRIEMDGNRQIRVRP